MTEEKFTGHPTALCEIVQTIYHSDYSFVLLGGGSGAMRINVWAFLPIHRVS